MRSNYMDKEHAILIVDDDPRIARLIERYLQEEGYRIYIASSANEMRKMMARETVDLVLLDVRLPDTDGFAVVKELRSQPNLAIIMVTGKADPIDQVLGLELGADDYVTKPFEERELLARVRSVLRRVSEKGLGSEVASSRTVACFAGWQLDVPARELTSPEGGRVILTTREFQLLAALVEHASHVLSRDAILEMLASEAAIDLVFSDIVMPGRVSGEDLYRWIREYRPDLKVLLTTGLRSAEIAARSQNGNSTLPIALPKPYTKAQLAAAIRDLLAIRG